MNICLCPVSDLLDHNPSRHVAWHTGPDGQDDFQFITFTPTSKVGFKILIVKAHDLRTLSLGRLTHHHLQFLSTLQFSD